MKLHVLILALLCCSMLHSYDEVSVRTIEGYMAYCRNQQWEVERDGQRYSIERYDVEKDLRNLPKNIADAQSILDHFSVSAPQQSDGSFRIKAHVRGNGGGPFTAYTLYYLTKSLWYGTTAAAAGEGMAHVAPPYGYIATTAIITTKAGMHVNQSVMEKIIEHGASPLGATMITPLFLPFITSSPVYVAIIPIKAIMKKYNIEPVKVAAGIVGLSLLGGGLEMTGEAIASAAWEVGMALPLP